MVIVIDGCASGVGQTTSNPRTGTSSASASPPQSAAPSVDIVPWSPETPQPPMPPAPTEPPDAAPCSVDQVAAGVAGWQGATGSMLGGFLIWNTSSEPRRRTGRPPTAIRDATGHRPAARLA